MYSTTITLRTNGSMTLPKKIRGKYKTIHYIVTEVPGGVFLKPIEEIEYYEEVDGTFGLRFPYGIDAGKLADMFEESNACIDKGEKLKKRKRRSSRNRNG